MTNKTDENFNCMKESVKCRVVQLFGVVESDIEIILTGRCHSSNGLTIVKKTLCKIGHTGHAEFIRLKCREAVIDIVLKDKNK